jgi:RNA polymerase sigma factor (sigma-70 family)
MTEKERILLAGCVKGEKGAWDGFVIKYSPLVYHTIKRTLTVYHAEAASDLVEDLYQEFFLSILRDEFKKLRQFRGERGCSLASWLRMVAVRLTVDALRKQSTANVEVSGFSFVDRADPSTSLNEREETSLLQALSDLSDRDRIFIDLYYRQDLPPEEIAAILKVSPGAVYTQKSRLLNKLRAILAKARSQ